MGTARAAQGPRHAVRPRVRDTSSAGGPTSVLLPTLGVNAYRYSLERSRLEPRPGEFCEDALAVERERAATLLRLGIEPCVTLNHYTHPRWFWERGGWEDPGVHRGIPKVHGSRRRRPGAAREALGDAERARRASARRVPRRRDSSGKARVPRGGARLRAHAPRPRRGGGRDPRARPRRADRHRAQHARVRARPRRPHSRPPARTRRRPPLQHGPSRGHRHRRPRLVVSRRGPDARADPGAAGRQRLRRRELLQPRAYPIPRPAGCDRRVRVSRSERPRTHGHRVGGPCPRVRRRSAEGGSGGQAGARDGERDRHGDDRRRCDFLREHLAVLAHRRAAGTPITGYFYWSLLDNFEWLEGFRPRFGLFEVDYTTFARRRRPSADVFAAMGRWFTGEGAAGEPFAASRT